jgi:hypothetical protein
VNFLPGDGPYQCRSVLQLAFHEGQAQLFGVIWPENRVIQVVSPDRAAKGGTATDVFAA